MRVCIYVKRVDKRDLVDTQSGEGATEVLGNVGHELSRVPRNLFAIILDLADLNAEALQVLLVLHLSNTARGRQQRLRRRKEGGEEVVVSGWRFALERRHAKGLRSLFRGSSELI